MQTTNLWLADANPNTPTGLQSEDKAVHPPTLGRPNREIAVGVLAIDSTPRVSADSR